MLHGCYLHSKSLHLGSMAATLYDAHSAYASHWYRVMHREVLVVVLGEWLGSR